MARAFEAAESTEPVSVTVAFLVSTSIDCERNAGSPWSAVLTCCVNAASSTGAPALPPPGVAEPPGAAVALFAAVDDASTPVAGAPLDIAAELEAAPDVLASRPEVGVPAVEDDGLVLAVYEELGADESVERDSVSVDVVVDAVPGLRWSHAASEVAAATAVIAVNAERVLAFILFSFLGWNERIATSVPRGWRGPTVLRRAGKRRPAAVPIVRLHCVIGEARRPFATV